MTIKYTTDDLSSPSIQELSDGIFDRLEHLSKYVDKSFRDDLNHIRQDVHDIEWLAEGQSSYLRDILHEISEFLYKVDIPLADKDAIRNMVYRGYNDKGGSLLLSDLYEFERISHESATVIRRLLEEVESNHKKTQCRCIPQLKTECEPCQRFKRREFIMQANALLGRENPTGGIVKPLEPMNPRLQRLFEAKERRRRAKGQVALTEEPENGIL